MFVPARDRRAGLTTPTVSYYDWFWNVSTVFSVWWPCWLHVFRDWYGDRADCTCSVTDDDRADCTCSVTDMVTVLTAPVPWLMMTVLTARVPWLIWWPCWLHVFRDLWWPCWLHVFRDWYDDRADCTCSVTDMMTVLTARVPWFIHTNRSICIYVYRNLFSLFRAISALSFKRINFILEEDNISSLYLHDLECSISNARDSLEHSWWYTAMSREQHVYVARTNDIKFNVDTI